MSHLSLDVLLNSLSQLQASLSLSERLNVMSVSFLLLVAASYFTIIAGDQHSPIRSAMRAGIGSVSEEIGGIQNEIEGQVFPSPASPLLHQPQQLSSLSPTGSLMPQIGLAPGSLTPRSGISGMGIAPLINPLKRLDNTGPTEGSVQAFVDMTGDQRFFPSITGHITLTQVQNGPVVISGSIRNLPFAGAIGMHFHENSAVPGDCSSVGEHFNPLHSRHGGENDIIRHIGDEGNIHIDPSGVARIAKSDFLISLQHGTVNSVLGRALTIHMRTDDLGKGLNRESGKSGNSGQKIACGTVTLPHNV